MRDETKFANAYARAKWLANFHNKPFYVVPTNDGYSVSSFDVDQNFLPQGTKTLKVDDHDTE